MEIAEQHAGSLHAESYTNPIFQAQFIQDYLPRFHESINGFSKEPPCMSCHAPMAYLQSGYDEAKALGRESGASRPCDRCHRSGGPPPGTPPEVHSSAEGISDEGVWRMTLVNPEARGLAHSGVGCDLCHTIVATAGKSTGNGRFVSKPGTTKYGPFPYERGAWHRAYSELHTKSEFCAICHNAVNRFGVEIRSTFSEWEQSHHAEQGIQCQDCHMTQGGFLTNGQPTYESGKAAMMSVGHAPDRERLYTHRFVGAASHSQIDGAVGVELAVDPPTYRPGDVVRVVLSVENSRAGHRFPTGSPELRSVWLDITAEVGDNVIRGEVENRRELYGVAGAHEVDFEFFGNDLPIGARIYRAVFVDADGTETLRFFDSVERVHDNRLFPGEVREEAFELRIPEDAPGAVQIVATVSYLRYPKAFADALGQQPFEPVVIARAQTTIDREL